MSRRNTSATDARIHAFLRDARVKLKTLKPGEKPRMSYLAQQHGLSPAVIIAAQDVGLMSCRGRSWTWSSGAPTKAEAEKVREVANSIYRR